MKKKTESNSLLNLFGLDIVDEIYDFTWTRCIGKLHLLSSSHIPNLNLAISEKSREDSLSFSVNICHVREVDSLYFTTEWGASANRYNTLICHNECVEKVPKNRKTDKREKYHRVEGEKSPRKPGSQNSFDISSHGKIKSERNHKKEKIERGKYIDDGVFFYLGVDVFPFSEDACKVFLDHRVILGALM